MHLLGKFGGENNCFEPVYTLEQVCLLPLDKSDPDRQVSVFGDLSKLKNRPDDAENNEEDVHQRRGAWAGRQNRKEERKNHTVTPISLAVENSLSPRSLSHLASTSAWC